MSYSYNLGADLIESSVGPISAPQANIFDQLMANAKAKNKAAAAAKASQPSTKEKLLSVGGKAIDIASSFARKQELQAEAAAKFAETQRINAAGSNIEKYILPIAIGGAALIGIIYFARKK